MGLETATRISELNGAWPLGTDPKSEGAPTGAGPGHLNILKNAVQGSFPDIGSGQVEATAEELTLSKTSMQTDVSVANDLADMDMATTPPIATNLMQFDGLNWVPVAADAAKLEGTAQYTGFGSLVGSQIVFTTTVSDNVPAGLAVITNAAGATGWILTATVDLELNLTLQGKAEASIDGTGDGARIEQSMGVTLEPASTAYFADAGEAAMSAWLGVDNNSQSSARETKDIRSAVTFIKVAAGEVVNLCTQRSTAGNSTVTWVTRDFDCTLSVREI
jgi:hypothetical protein